MLAINPLNVFDHFWELAGKVLRRQDDITLFHQVSLMLLWTHLAH